MQVWRFVHAALHCTAPRSPAPPGAAHMSSTACPGRAPSSSGGTSDARSSQYQQDSPVAASRGGGGYPPPPSVGCHNSGATAACRCSAAAGPMAPTSSPDASWRRMKALGSATWRVGCVSAASSAGQRATPNCASNNDRNSLVEVGGWPLPAAAVAHGRARRGGRGGAGGRCRESRASRELRRTDPGHPAARAGPNRWPIVLDCSSETARMEPHSNTTLTLDRIAYKTN
jgi:hypothetical protein